MMGHEKQRQTQYTSHLAAAAVEHTQLAEAVVPSGQLGSVLGQLQPHVLQVEAVQPGQRGQQLVQHHSCVPPARQLQDAQLLGGGEQLQLAAGAQLGHQLEPGEAGGEAGPGPGRGELVPAEEGEVVQVRGAGGQGRHLHLLASLRVDQQPGQGTLVAGVSSSQPQHAAVHLQQQFSE